MACYTSEIKNLAQISVKLFVSFILISMILCSNAFADEAVSLAHSAPLPEELPFPGSPMQLAVTLLNSRNSQLSVRAFVVRDGKLMTIDLKNVSTDPYERVVYWSNINAPLGEISYRFILSGPTGIMATSERYSVQRECRPNVETIDANLSESITGNSKLKIQQKQATALQDELKNYELAIKLLEELRALTEK
jgi:hypothetical protein